ncbi:MAG: dihydrofolate reductase family protein [Acidimicrobiales bacterium]
MQSRITTDNNIDPFEDFLATDRRGRHPWVMANMVTSIDGASAADGTSGGLGGPGDQTVFKAIRDLSDVIIVGSSTAAVENYHPPLPNKARQTRRTNNGAAPGPVVALVSKSLKMDPLSKLFSDDKQRPIIITPESADTERINQLGDVAEMIVVGGDQVTPRAASQALFDRGYYVQLIEGGPRLLGQFLQAQIIDEFFVTLAPKLVGGPSPRIAVGSGSTNTPMELASVLQDGDELYLRYVSSRARQLSQHDPGAAATPR